MQYIILKSVLLYIVLYITHTYVLTVVYNCTCIVRTYVSEGNPNDLL